MTLLASFNLSPFKYHYNINLITENSKKDKLKMGNICGGPQREKDLESYPPHNSKAGKGIKNVSDPPSSCLPTSNLNAVLTLF